MAGLLIIDDDPVSAALLRHLLQRSGYACRVAGDAASAWQLLSPEVALVLLDIQMPGDNGPEILRRMRLDPTLADIPVIFVTARTDPATRIHCLAMGAAGFVTKPIDREDVLDQVRAALARSRDDDPDDDVDPLEAALDQEGGAPSGEAAAGEAPAGMSAELLRDLLAERRAMRRALASHRRLVSALFRLHQAMRDGASPPALAGTVVALARRALRARAAELWTRDGDAVRPLRAADGEPPRSNGGGATTSARFREPAVRRAFAEWLTVTTESDGAGEIDVYFPLAGGAERVGVLSMRFAADGLPSESLTGFFCAEVALALASASRLHRSQREAVADALTGLYNRRYFEGRLGVEIERARACGEPLSLLFVDVDRFKWVNDTLGHDMGDRLLRLLASRISGTVRGVDVVCRYGGDEMVVILPGTDVRGCRIAANRLQEAVAGGANDVLPDDVRLTVTVGGATYPEDGETAAELVASADAAMLRGKRAGRDRIELFTAAGEPAAAGLGPQASAANAEDPPRGDPLGGLARNTRMTGQLLRSMIGALHVRDPGTADHSRAVSGLSARLARQLGASDEEVHLAGQVGLLHDVGKLHTPSSILLKPGPLDAEERAIMNLHAEKGAELVESVDGIRHLAAAVRASQEHFDGSGYPDGLAGDAIPLVARIVAVADAYHAMTSDRVYRAAMSSAEAEAELRRCAGTQFDPVVVEAMVEIARRETRH